MVYLPFPNSRYTPFGHSILVAYLSRGMLHAVQITEVKFTKKVFGWIADKKIQDITSQSVALFSFPRDVE